MLGEDFRRFLLNRAGYSHGDTVQHDTPRALNGLFAEVVPSRRHNFLAEFCGNTHF